MKHIFQAIIGRRRNELKNAAGLVSKLRIIVAVQDLKISFHKQILVLPPLWMLPLTSFALATALDPTLDSSNLISYSITHLLCANKHLRLRDCDLLGANFKILFEFLV